MLAQVKEHAVAIVENIIKVILDCALLRDFRTEYIAYSRTSKEGSKVPCLGGAGDDPGRS
jgi:hypothetical protein